MLQEVMCRQLDFLVPPLRCPINAGDQRRTVHPPQVTEDERIPRLGLISRTFGQAEMPGGVLLPGVPFQKGVLVVGPGLHLTPVAIENILPGVDQPAAVFNCGLVERVFRQCLPPFRVALKSRDKGFLCEAEPVVHAHHEAARILIRKCCQLVGSSRILNAKASRHGESHTGQGT
jgi:hypothetical protein